MADIRPFPAVRPKKEKALLTSSCSFEDVLNMIQAEDLYQYHVPAYFVYEIKSEDRMQTGIFACASIDDYLKQLIKNHEDYIDERKEEIVGRIDSSGLQTDPVVIAYHDQGYIETLTLAKKDFAPTYEFDTPDGAHHSIWSIDDFSKVKNMMEALQGTTDFYIVSGHAAAASAVEIGLKRRAQNPGYDGSEEFNYFLCVLLPYTAVNEGGSWYESKLHKFLLSHAI